MSPFWQRRGIWATCLKSLPRTAHGPAIALAALALVLALALAAVVWPTIRVSRIDRARIFTGG